MGLYKGTTRYANIVNVGGGAEPILESISIDRNGVYSPKTGIDGFDKINTEVPYVYHNPSPYLDENGKFKKPEEWDDIESISFIDNEQVVYYLYDNTKTLSWCGVKVTTSGSNSFCQYGRIRNGVFIPLLTETKSSGSTYGKVLSDEFPDEDYIVLKIYPTSGKNITKVELASYTYNSRALTQAQQTLLMRYGNLPYAQTISCGSLYLVSDNLIGCGSLTTLSGLYSGCNNLVRHRHTGWNTTNVTSASSMFNACYALTDCDTDFSGWFNSNKLTTLASFMINCYSLKGSINVSGWNTSNVTTIDKMFNNCYSLIRIIGIENWYLPKTVLTTSHYPFQNCYSLEQNEQGKLDLSRWQLGIDSTANTGHASFFSQCRRLKEIDISTWNLTKTSSLSGMFNQCNALENVNLPDNIGSDGLLTTIATMFSYCYMLKNVDFSKINLSNVQSMNTCLQYALSLETFIPATTTPVGSSGTSQLGGFLNYAYELEDLDLSWLDVSKYTNATSQYSNMLTNCAKLKNFIPPIKISNAFGVGTCPNLTRESLLAIINNLVQLSTTKTITLGTVNLAKLTTDEIATITGKGWTVA